jgi:tetratricopeptide (TPR) repeat protein
MRACIITILMISMATAQSNLPATFDELSRKADAARAADRLDEAVLLYRRALRLKPAWAEGWFSLGTIFYDSDRHAECADAFTRFVAVKPDVGPAHALLGLCEFGRGNYDAALHHLFRGNELGYADNAQIREVALYHTALALILRRNFERAIEQLSILVNLSPAPNAVRSAAGLAVLRMAILPDRIPAADRTLVDRVGEAALAQMERRAEEAGRLFERLLVDYPKSPELHYAYGSLLLNSNPSRGVALLKEELTVSPEHVPTLASLAYEYLKEGDPSQALPYGEKAARLAPGDFAARTAYGRALLEQGRVPDAIRELETAVKLAPDSPQARFALANAYTQAGRPNDADRERKEFNRLRKLLDSGRK